jgi:hypothetical protein
MRAPREILFERHRAVAPKLDAIRRESVGQASSLSQNQESETGKMPVLLLIWRELIFPCRRIWAGLATIWILILAVNFSMRDPSQTAMTKAFAPEMMSFNEQQKLLNELLADRSLPMDSERPKTFSPKPRTETSEFLIV